VKEARWRAETAAPDIMLKFVRETISDRKLRLFAVACCRRIWHLISSEQGRNAVEVAERFAEGTATLGKLKAARLTAGRSGVTVAKNVAVESALTAAKRTAWEAQVLAAVAAYEAAGRPTSLGVRDQAWDDATRAHCDLIRDLINPFNPSSLSPAWVNRTVRQIAEAIYAERAFDRMPILADALEDAGCTEEQILTHLRDSGPHARGCWLLDLLLGKS
jgi:hypothetical protein